jgi:GNAT superfamily N-acetyltransferase
VIRRATPKDLTQITHVRISVQENHLSVGEMAARGITPEMITKAMHSGTLSAWVAEIESRIVAFSMADKASGRVFALFTMPDQEGRGFGSGLLQCCEVWLRDSGVRRAGLDTARNSKAVHFYEKRGWRLDTENSSSEDVEMIKDL